MREAREIGAWIGVDWADKRHVGVLHDCASGEKIRFEVTNTAESLHAWLAELKQQFSGKTVGVALEAGKTLLLHVLLEYDWVEVWPIHPDAAANYRKAFSPSGAKDDPRDAASLLDMLLNQRDKLEPLRLLDEDSQLLGGLCQERRNAVNERTKLVQKLDAKLKLCFPQAREIAGSDLTLDVACSFIIQYPDLASAKKAKEATLKKFFYQHNVRSRTAVANRLSRLAEATPATTASGVLEPLKLAVKGIARQIKALNDAIRAFDKAIAEAFKAHADRELFSSLPGAGPALAPRLASAIGSDRRRYQSAVEIQCSSGIAPITESSGNRKWVHRRWRCPKFTLQTFHEYADQSIRWSPWAKAYYQMRKANDKNASHHAIVRALAYKWIRIIYACWKSNTEYSEEHYQQTLRAKSSPIANYL